MTSTRTFTIALTSLVLATGAAGCGGDDDTISTAGTSGATGVSEAGGAAADLDAEAAARTAQTIVETLATDQNGSYAGIDAAAVAQLEPSLSDADLTVTGDKTTYTIDANAASGATYSVTRDANGKVEYPCDPPGTGDCPDDGVWN